MPLARVSLGDPSTHPTKLEGLLRRISRVFVVGGLDDEQLNAAVYN